MDDRTHQSAPGQRRLIIAVLGLLLSPVVLAQGIYRWTDENGQVHFSDTPPTNQQADRVTVQGSAPTGGTPDAVKAIAEHHRKLDEERRLAAEEATAAAEEAEYRASVCANARNRLEKWSYYNTRTNYEQPDGSVKRYLPEEMEAMVAEDRQKVNENCN